MSKATNFVFKAILLILKIIIRVLLVILAITLFPLTLYFLPSIIAFIRNNNFSAILVLNLFLGWTLVFWVVSLAWALASKNG
ncbi:MAG: superinfection immunity protein [Bacteroidota bacterium]